MRRVPGHVLQPQGDRSAGAGVVVGLVATGSSDFHGTHKTVRLGAFTTSREAYEKIAAAATGLPVL